MFVRRATADDARSIAAIHVHAWQAAYQGIVPQAFLSSLSVDEREGVFREILEKRTSETWVADESGEVVGWIGAARSRDEDALSSTGEVGGIYVDPRHWRRGAGELLWHEAEGHLRDSGFTDVTLWVFQENAPAITFYESMGFAVEPGREKRFARGGAEIRGIRLRKSLGGRQRQPPSHPVLTRQSLSD